MTHRLKVMDDRAYRGQAVAGAFDPKFPPCGEEVKTPGHGAQDGEPTGYS
jgi:hypothetical protein